MMPICPRTVLLMYIIWNSLPDGVVLAPSVNSFKKRLFSHDLSAWLRWACSGLCVDL